MKTSALNLFKGKLLHYKPNYCPKVSIIERFHCSNILFIAQLIIRSQAQVKHTSIMQIINNTSSCHHSARYFCGYKAYILENRLILCNKREQSLCREYSNRTVIYLRFKDDVKDKCSCFGDICTGDSYQDMLIRNSTLQLKSLIN